MQQEKERKNTKQKGKYYVLKDLITQNKYKGVNIQFF